MLTAISPFQVLRDLFNDSSLQVHVVDADSGRLIDCNEGALEALGYSRSELLARYVHDLDVNIDTPEKFRELRFDEGPTERVFLTRHRRKDGTHFPVEAHVRRLRSEDGNFLLAICRDVSANRRLQRDLRESKREFEQLVRNLPGLVYQYTLANERAHVSFIDERIAAWTGISAAELLAGDAMVGDSIAAEDRGFVSSAVRGLVEAQGGSVELRYRLRHRDGTLRLVQDHISVRVAELPEGTAVVQGIAFDITERDALERELRAAWGAEHERYERVASMSGQVVHEWDLRSGTIAWGKTLHEVLGWTPEQHGPRFTEWLRRVHPDDRTRLGQEVARAISSNRLIEIEYRYRHADGSYRWVWDRGQVVRGSDGVPRRITVVMQDVTRRKEMESQIASVQRMETVGALAGGVAHDVNNYLAAIVGNLGVLNIRLRQMGWETSADWPELADAQAAAEGCADLVKSLLVFARQQQPKRERTRVGDLVESSLRMLQRLAGPAIEIKAVVRNATAELECDAVQVQQVLMNLVANAREAMDGAGQIRLGTRVSERAHRDDGVRQRFIHLWVEDSGPGIAAELKDRVFEPYFTTRPFGGGTGLGLAIVHGIARAHGGWAEVSRSRGGARISVFFPAD